MLGKPSAPNRYRPYYFLRYKNLGLFVRTAIFFLFLSFGFTSYALYHNGGFQYPRAKGLNAAEGLYNVSVFEINGKVLPYSLTDTLRWQNVVFEKWPTISIQSNRQLIPEEVNTEEIYVTDENRNYESSGSVGRHFYSYSIDSLHTLLNLQNKNKHHRTETWTLHYKRPSANRIILSGSNERNDAVYVELDRINKVYLLDESYKIPGKRNVFDKP
jgi:hypothetical protein